MLKLMMLACQFKSSVIDCLPLNVLPSPPSQPVTVCCHSNFFSASGHFHCCLFLYFPSDNQCDCFRYFHLHPWLTTIPHFYTRAPLIAFPTFNTFLMNFFLYHCLLPWGRPSFYFLFHLFLSPAWCSMIRNQISKELMMDRSLNLWSKKRWNRLWIVDQILEWTDKQRNQKISNREWQRIGEKKL